MKFEIPGRDQILTQVDSIHFDHRAGHPRSACTVSGRGWPAGRSSCSVALPTGREERAGAAAAAAAMASSAEPQGLHALQIVLACLMFIVGILQAALRHHY